MAQRRTGQTGQIDFQGRSHQAADCGSYRLIRRTAPNTWLVEWIAPCDQPDRQSTLRFVSRESYDRYF